MAIAEGRTYFESEAVLQNLPGDKLAILFSMTFPPPPATFDSVLVSMMDITERKRAEYLTGQVFESSPDGISIIGRDYRYQRVNPVYERNWGMPVERIVGMHVAALLGREVFEQTVKPHLDRCFAGEVVRYAVWFTNTLGRQYLAVSYSPLRPDAARVEDAGGTPSYRRVDALAWSTETLAHGKTIKITGFPKDHQVRRFRVEVSTHRTDGVVTNDQTQEATEATQEAGGFRWKIEPLHREGKQVTGLERCQCRKARLQRHHIGGAFLVWVRLKALAVQTGRTVYQLKHGWLDDDLIQQLKSPSLKMVLA